MLAVLGRGSSLDQCSRAVWGPRVHEMRSAVDGRWLLLLLGGERAAVFGLEVSRELGLAGWAGAVDGRL